VYACLAAVLGVQDFPFSEGTFGWDYAAVRAQDAYNVPLITGLYDKWEAIKAQLVTSSAAASSGSDSSGTFMNYLSASGGVAPWFAASGKSAAGTGAPRLSTGRTTPAWSSWPDFPRVQCALGMCTIAYKGMNELTMEWLQRASNPGSVGIVVTDFPGSGLIDAIIARNPATC
jgi:1-phosphatidylinositol phosphodiesterase